MKKKEIRTLLFVLLVALTTPIYGVTVTETQFTMETWNETIGVSNQDTFQTTHPDWMLIESGPSVWGDIKTAAMDAGSDWWAHNTSSTIGIDGAGSYVHFIWNSGWDSDGDGFRTLDRVDILVAAGETSDRVNYEFHVQTTPTSNWGAWATTVGTVIGGSNTVGTGTMISITDIGISDVAGVRIWSNPVEQPNGAQMATEVMEIDVYLVPEPNDPGPSNDFTGGVTRVELEDILSKTISIAPLTIGDGVIAPYFEDNLRMIENLSPKFIGRASYTWGVWASTSAPNTADDEEFFTASEDYASQVHAQDQDIILEACIFETAYSSDDPATADRIAMGFSGAGVEQIPVPDWVFIEFGEPVVTRNFSYDDMLYDDNRFRDHWLPGASIPDLTQLETQMWFYYRARRFIDAGYEAINLAQIHPISQVDTGYTVTKSLMDRIRAYAATNARRHWVFMSAHTHGITVSGELLFDFHLFPIRATEIIGSPYQAELQMGYADSIYGDSLGGVSPSGWSCDNLPYLVEFDNGGGSNGDPTHAPTTDTWLWGWDEISWFARQDEDGRNDWLWYAVNWIAENDSNGGLMMPGARVVQDPIDTPFRGLVWGYKTNTWSDGCNIGYNQEETIKDIWYSGCTAASKANMDDDCGVDLSDFAIFAGQWMNNATRVF